MYANGVYAGKENEKFTSCVHVPQKTGKLAGHLKLIVVLLLTAKKCTKT